MAFCFLIRNPSHSFLQSFLCFFFFLVFNADHIKSVRPTWGFFTLIFSTMSYFFYDFRTASPFPVVYLLWFRYSIQFFLHYSFAMSFQSRLKLVCFTNFFSNHVLFAGYTVIKLTSHIPDSFSHFIDSTQRFFFVSALLI